MRAFILVFVLSAAVASAYVPPGDPVLHEGRILQSGTRPMQSYPWVGEPPPLSEFPETETTISPDRGPAAIWEVRDERLYLVGLRTFKQGAGAPLRPLGLRDLMPARVEDGKVFADWFTGTLVMTELERAGLSVALRPQQRPERRVVSWHLEIVEGRVVGRERTSGPESAEHR